MLRGQVPNHARGHNMQSPYFNISTWLLKTPADMAVVQLSRILSLAFETSQSLSSDTTEEQRFCATRPVRPFRTTNCAYLCEPLCWHLLAEPKL